MIGDVEGCRRRLTTIDGGHPDQVREGVLGALVGLTGANEAVGYHVRKEGGRFFRRGFLTAARGAQSGQDAYEGSELLGTRWDPERPLPSHVRRFQGPTALLGRGFRDLEVFDSYYGAFGVSDFARLLVYDGARFSQYVSVHAVDGASLGDGARRDLDGVVEAASAALAYADRWDRELLERTPTVLLDAAGNVREASDAAEAWLSPSRRTQLGSVVRAFDTRGETLGSVRVDHASCRLVRCDGDQVRYVCMLASSGVVTSRPTLGLTDRQLEVADLLVAGATVGQIAEWLGVSPHTAKDHTKALYRKLGVANRVELARQLEQTPRLNARR